MPKRMPKRLLTRCRTVSSTTACANVGANARASARATGSRGLGVRMLAAVVVGAAWLALLLACAPAEAQIGLSPSRFDLQLGERPTTESVRVFNFGKEPIDIQVSVVHWDLDEANQVRALPPTEQSLDQWLVINPLTFSINGESSQTVRFSIRPRVEPEPGEHRAMIYFRQLPPPTPPKGARFLYNVGIAVYGQVGEVTRHARIGKVELVGSSISLELTCLGTANARFAGQLSIWPADQYPGAEATKPFEDLKTEGWSPPEPVIAAGELPTTPILPGTTRTFTIPLDVSLAPGSYVLDLEGQLGDDRLDRAIELTVAPAADAEPDPRPADSRPVDPRPVDPKPGEPAPQEPTDERPTAVEPLG